MANNLRSGRVPPGPTQRTMPSSPSPRLLLVLHLLLFLPLVPLLPPNLLARVSVFPILFYSFFLLSFPISLQPLQSFSAFLSSQWSPSLVGLFSSMFYSANNDQVIANRIGHLAHSHASMTIVVRSRIGAWPASFWPLLVQEVCAPLPFLLVRHGPARRVDTYRSVDNSVSEIPAGVTQKFKDQAYR